MFQAESNQVPQSYGVPALATGPPWPLRDWLSSQFRILLERVKVEFDIQRLREIKKRIPLRDDKRDFKFPAKFPFGGIQIKR